MKLVDRYIIRNLFAPFLFGTGTVIFIFLMQFLMISLEQLVGKGLSEWLIVKLIVYNMAWMVILAVPMGVLFSTLMSFGSMAMAHEVTIVKASGGSLLRMMAPVVVTSFLLYIALFWFNDRILPESNHQVKIMMNDIQRKKPTFALESGLFSTQLDGYTLLSRNVDSLTGALSGVTIYDMTKFQSRNIISADSGWISFTPDYKKLLLDLKNGEVHQLNVNSADNYKVIQFSSYRIAMNAHGFAFEESRGDMVSKGDREMNVADMSAIVDTAISNKSNIKSRLDTVLTKNIRDILIGRNLDVAKKDSANTVITVKNQSDSLIEPQVVVKSKPKSKPKAVTVIKSDFNDEDEEGRIIRKTLAKQKKSQDTGLSYMEQIKQKFNKAIASGNTEFNKDTVVSVEKQADINARIEATKKEITIQEEKKKILSAIKSESVNKEKTDKPRDTAKIDISVSNNTSTQDKIYSNYDTSYPEVLNRVIQQANIIKSTLQPDINNIRFFESREEQYKVEIYKKYALPFACIVFVFVGCPLGVKTKGGNFGISAGISLGFYIFYWACLIGGEKLADRGMVTPWLAMWLANIIVGLMGIFLTVTVNNESFSFNRIKKIFIK